MLEENIDLMAAAESLAEYWSPKVVARVNDQYVKVAKLRGHLAWHRHEHEDELFYVLRGNLKIEYEGESTLKPVQCTWSQKASFTIR